MCASEAKSGAISVQLNNIISESAITRRIVWQQYNPGCTWPLVFSDTFTALFTHKLGGGAYSLITTLAIILKCLDAIVIGPYSLDFEPVVERAVLRLDAAFESVSRCFAVAAVGEPRLKDGLSSV